MPEIERSKHAYEQIHDDLIAGIQSGRFRIGDLLPSVRELAVAWHTSPATADRALAWLATDGDVKRSRRGTIVIAGRTKPGPQSLLTMTRLPEAGRVQVTAAEYEARCPRYIWPLLGLEPVRMDGLCPVIRREQLWHDPDGVPFMLSVDWVPPRFTDVRGLLPAPGDEPEPVLSPAALIQEQTGIAVVRGRDGLEARAPRDDGREVPMLRLGELTPASKRRPAVYERVLAVVWSWFSDGDAVVYTEAVLPENRVIEHEYAVMGGPPPT